MHTYIYNQNVFYISKQSRQFVDNIFQTEWLEVDKNIKKSLIIIMKRTTMPIEITSAYTISMNLESFVGVSIKILNT